MFSLDVASGCLTGPKGQLLVPAADEALVKLVMLIEGQCLGLGGTAAARKYGYSKPRYFQLLRALGEHGLEGLMNQKRGPKRRWQRTDEAVRQIIRHRFLDPEATLEVVTQKLRQTGFALSVRTVRRVIEDYALQKKTLRRGTQAAGRRR